MSHGHIPNISYVTMAHGNIPNIPNVTMGHGHIWKVQTKKKWKRQQNIWVG